MNIAIDGPAGAGKSTVAQRIADRLGYVYIDTGAMYRALTLLVLEHRIDPEDEAEVVELLDETDISFRREGSVQRVTVNGRDVTEDIRTPEVSSQVSHVAQLPGVRSRMLQRQRLMAEKQNTVMDGRDIGTHVLPDADVKIFLTASVDERARRRAQELKDKGYDPDLEELRAEIERRDKIDSERKVAPLKQAEDAIWLDTTDKSIAEVVQQIANLCENRKGQ